MKPHSREQVEALKGYADSNSESEVYESFEFLDWMVHFRVVHFPPEVKPFDYAVAAAVIGHGESATYEIIVSDDVPEDLRGLWAWHEFNDFANLGHEASHRCLKTEAAIAWELDQEKLRHYVDHRVKFYQGLARYILEDIARNGQDSTYSLEDYEGALEAENFLGAFKRLA